MAEHLPSMLEVLSLIPTTAKKKKGKKGRLLKTEKVNSL
jgi:hypothetical protein